MELVSKIYEALEDDDALEALPNLIAKEIGARSCTLQLFTPEFQLEGSWLTHFNGEMYEFYEKNNLHLYDAWTNTNLHVFGTDRTERHTDFLPIEEFRNSFFYNEFIRKFGDDSAFCIGFISTRPDGGYLTAGLHNGLTDEDFTDEQVAHYDSLRVHLTRMMVLRRNLMVRESLATGALVGIDSIKDAYLVVRNDRRIFFANASAETLLKEGGLLKSVSGRLFLANTKDDVRLVQALRDSAANEANGKASFAVLAPDNNTWRFTIAPKNFERETMLLIWIDRCQIPASASEMMRQIYDLTQAEVPVLMAVSEGLSANQISNQLQVSVATVRSHIQHIYQKTGVNKASKLAHLVSSLPRIK